LTVTACGTPPSDAPSGSIGDQGEPDGVAAEAAVQAVESAIRQFYADVNAFDHAAIRETTTSDFEFMDGGRRMDGDTFETFLRGVESGGTTLDFELSELNTEVEGDVAYSSYLASTPRSTLLEASVLRRSGGRWLVDRTISAGTVPQ
jgi:ketosteroid isomerase-like protein